MSLGYNYKVLILGISVLAVTISLVTVFSYVSAQLTEGVTQDQIDAALDDLSGVYGKEVATQEQAREICNLDKYVTDCAEIGRKHNLFPPDRIEQVNAILDEIKGQVAEQIKSCESIECLVGVAQSLASQIVRKDPDLASRIDLTPTIVREKKEIVEIAKSIGVTIDQCIEMDPDTAPVELLRTCARLAKENKVQKYIPTEARAQVNQIADSTERSAQLKEALTGGRYQCGDNTINGCGNFCLNPGTEARAQGTSAIPAVCKEIAAQFFGPQGIRELESAYSKVSGVADYYYRKAQNFVFTTLDGQTLTSPEEIGAYLEAEGRAGNVEAVSKGMDFMVAQGLATPADKDFAVKMVSKFREKGGVDFDACVQNPKACQEFIHDDFQKDFNVMEQVFDIMRQELGFSPDLCDQGQFDQSIGIKCLEGAKRALPKIEALASQYPEVRSIVEEIRNHILRGDQLTQRRDQFTVGNFAGPGGCRDERSCFVYCSNAANSPECIAFGAKEGLSGFTGDQAVTKYQQYENSLNRTSITSQPVQGQGQIITGDVIYGYGTTPECVQAIKSGDFVRAKEICNVPAIGGPQPVPGEPFTSSIICPALPYVQCPEGQYHESFRNNNGCFTDGPCKPIPTFSPGPYPSPISGNNFCGGVAGVPCPSGYRCQLDGTYPDAGGRCVSETGVLPYPTYTPYPGDATSCPGFSYSRWDKTGTRYCQLNETRSCEFFYPAYLDRTNYSPTECPTEDAPYPSYSPGPGGGSCSKSLTELLGSGCHQMYNDSSGRQIYCDGPMTKSAKEGDTATTPGCLGATPTYTPYPGSGSCPSGYHYHGEQGGFCMNDREDYSGTCYSADGKTTIKCPSQPTSQCAPPQWWDPARGYCVGSTVSPSPGPGIASCPAGYHYHSESGGFCMNDREDYAGTCYTSDGKNQTTCPRSAYPSPYPTTSPTSSGTCPSGSHIMYVNNAGGYCMADGDSSKCGPLNSGNVSSFGSCGGYQTTASYTPYPSSQSCPSGQWWDPAISACKSTTPSNTYSPPPSCPSGQWWDYQRNACTSTTSCGSGYYWDSANSVCKPSGTSTSYTPAPSCPSGQWWDQASNSCRSSTSSGVCGNGSCESTETSSSCPSDCGSYAPTYTPYVGYCGDNVCGSSETSSSCPSDCGGGAGASYTPYPTTQYTPYPTTEYTPPPSTYSPPPESSPPPPTSGALYHHLASIHCAGLNRVWDGQYCQPTGFLARVVENTLANLGKLIGF